MFTIQQTAQTSSSTTLLGQVTIPNPTTVANQSIPACGVSLNVSLNVKIKGQLTPFITNIVIQMPNQTGFDLEGCS
jgi:hypothetical protein